MSKLHRKVILKPRRDSLDVINICQSFLSVCSLSVCRWHQMAATPEVILSVQETVCTLQSCLELQKTQNECIVISRNGHYGSWDFAT